MSLNFSNRVANLSPFQRSIGFALAQCFVATPIVIFRSQKNQNRGDGVWDEKTIPTKIANLIIYGPSALFAYYQSTKVIDNAKIAKLLLAHFGKRAVELFVMQKNNKPDETPEETPIKVVAFTSIYYSVGTYLIATNALPMPIGVDFSQALFWMAELGHSLHRYLMEQQQHQSAATMTSTARTTSPSAGGLYRYIVAPHLLFDIVAWVGLAACARQAQGYTQAALMVLLLGWEAKKLNNSSTDNGDNGNTTTSRSASSEKQRRWVLIPFLF